MVFVHLQTAGYLGLTGAQRQVREVRQGRDRRDGNWQWMALFQLLVTPIFCWFTMNVVYGTDVNEPFSIK